MTKRTHNRSAKVKSSYVVRKSEEYEDVEQKLFEDGYLYVLLTNDEGSRWLPIHLLVAKAFLEPPPGDVGAWYVDHIDGNKTNNNATNLRWVLKGR